MEYLQSLMTIIACENDKLLDHSWTNDSQWQGCSQVPRQKTTGIRDGISIRDQWKRPGRRATGNRWLYRLWNSSEGRYLSATFPHDPTVDRRLPGCGLGDCWVSEQRTKLTQGTLDAARALLSPTSLAPTPAGTSFANRFGSAQANSLQWVGKEFLESVRNSGRSQGHIDAIEWTLTVVRESGVDDLFDPQLTKVLQGHIATLTARRPGQKSSVPLSTRTKNHHVHILHSIGNYAEGKNWFDRNPLRSLKKMAEAKRNRAVYTIDELRVMLSDERQNHSWWRFVALAAYTGLRSSTLTQLTWPMVRWDISRLHVPAHLTKGKRDVLAPIRSEFMQLLKHWKLNDAPLVPKECSASNSDRANECFQKFLKTCAIDRQGRGVHTFRHTVASLLTATGTTAFGIMDAIGHESPVSSKHYAQGAEEFRNQVHDESWEEGQFYLRSIPAALQPFSIDLIKDMIKPERGPSPAWLLGVLTVYLGLPATSVVKLRREHFTQNERLFRDPTLSESPEFRMPDDLAHLFIIHRLPVSGAIFPVSWQELPQETLEAKLESFWQDIGIPIGRRRSKALWLGISVLRRAVGFPTTTETPPALLPYLEPFYQECLAIVNDEGWDGEELWLMQRRRRRTIGGQDMG